MKTFLPIFILILLAGCSSTPEMPDELKAEMYAPIICEEPDCNCGIDKCFTCPIMQDLSCR